MSTRVVCLSDTHSYHNSVIVPNGDWLIFAGDLSWQGEMSIIASFADWLGDLPHKKKICIFGNHEIGMRNGPNRKTALKLIENSGAIYLEDSGVEIDGLNVWGSPFSPTFYNWEFMANRGEDIGYHWAQIPDDTNVLITHGPGFGTLDAVQGVGRGPQGCEMLSRRIKNLPNLKVNCFGHLHKSGGMSIVKDGVTFVNAAICTDEYKPINPPVVIDI